MTLSLSLVAFLLSHLELSFSTEGSGGLNILTFHYQFSPQLIQSRNQTNGSLLELLTFSTH